MKDEERLRILISRARAEKRPQVDVVDRVMRALRPRRPRSAERIDPWAWVAAPALVGAVVAVVAAFTGGDSWSDILVATLSDLPWWML